MIDDLLHQSNRSTLTRPHRPEVGSALAPVVEEVSFVAWRLASASPGLVRTERSLQAVTATFARIVETCWLPGRASVVSELATVREDGVLRLVASLVVGIFGPTDATGPEAAAVAAVVDTRLHAPGLPYVAERVEPAQVLDIAAHKLSHGALVRQRSIMLDDPLADGVEVLSRWNPPMSPWSAVAAALLARDVPTRVRATTLATEVAVTDRLQLESAVRRIAPLRRGEWDVADDRPDRTFQAERALATLVDLQASFATPVLCAEVAITSSAALPEIFLRDIATCFTGEVDVLRHQGRNLVAAQRLMLGGFTLSAAPPELANAHRLGLPVRGGVSQRGLADLVTLFESPIGWPIPLGAAISTIPSATMRSLAVPPGLSRGTAIGAGPGGVRVHLPAPALDRHCALIGASGSGKSAVLEAAALADLAAQRPFLLLDPHGQLAKRVVAFAAAANEPVVAIDAADSATQRLSLLEANDPAEFDLGAVERGAARLCEAIVASLSDPAWAGPRWLQIARAMMVLAAVRQVHIADVVAWMTDASTLRESCSHPMVPAQVATVLLAPHSPGYSDSAAVLDWVTAKFAPFTALTGRRIVAAPGHGLSPAEVLAARMPIIINLAALPRPDASTIGHLFLSTILDAAIERGGDAGPLRVYVDEAQRFAVPALTRIQTEGRKFGVSVAVATQTLTGLDPVLADLMSSAAVKIAFRQTPASAAALGGSLDLDPLDLVDLPDLQAYVKVNAQPTCSVTIDPYRPAPPRRARSDH